MKNGIGLFLGTTSAMAISIIDKAVVQIITGTAPVIAAFTDGAALSTAFTSGIYSSTAGTIVILYREMNINGAGLEPYNGAVTPLAGQTVEVVEYVSDSAGTTAVPFTSNTVTVGAAAEVSEITALAVTVDGDIEFEANRAMTISYVVTTAATALTATEIITRVGAATDPAYGTASVGIGFNTFSPDLSGVSGDVYLQMTGEAVGIPTPAVPAYLGFSYTPVAPTFELTATGPYYRDPVILAPQPSVMTFVCEGTVVANGVSYMFADNLNSLFIGMNSVGSPYMLVKDSAGTSLCAEYQTGSPITRAGKVTLVACIDIGNSTAKLWEDGVLKFTKALPASTGLFRNNSKYGYFANGASYTNQWRGVITRVSMYPGVASVAGEIPASGEVHPITGPIAVANGDAWKLGANAI